MIKYSTPNDLLRLLRQEETEEKSIFNKPEYDQAESIALLREMLDGLYAEPAEHCIRKVLEYSRSLNHL